MFSAHKSRIIHIASLLLFTFAFVLQARAENYSDLWSNPNEPGWGVAIADHQSDMFAVFLTYDQNNRPTWLVMPGGEMSADRLHFNAAIYRSTGPAFTTTPYDPTLVTVTQAGVADFDFAPADLGPGQARFTYTIDGITRSKAMERQAFGSAPANWGFDMTDLWWNPDMSGTAVSITQHGDTAFAIVLNYDIDGAPLFSVLPDATRNALGGFNGRLYTATGPYFGAETYDATLFSVQEVGQGGVYPLQVQEAKGFDINSECPCAPLSAQVQVTLRDVPISSDLVPLPFGEMTTQATTKARAR